jgi:hypothetical protein
VPGLQEEPPLKAVARKRPWQVVLPGLVSAALLGWLVWRVSPARLVEAAALLDWPGLALATVALVLGLFFWDAVCLRWLFARLGPALPYQVVLQARGCSYLLSAANYELGQGMLAWRLARAQGTSLARALGGCLLLAWHDAAVLLLLGLAGALSSTDPRAQAARWFCLAGLGILLALGIGGALLVGRRLAGGPRWWDWRRAGQLGLLRAAYYAITLAYAATGLYLCGVAVDVRVVGSVVPLVLLADGLPVSVSGLGTREATLLYLLDPEQPAVVLAFSLVWSTGLMTGRLALGLAYCWAAGFAPRRAGQSGEE